jgi:hypothetical protein
MMCNVVMNLLRGARRSAQPVAFGCLRQAIIRSRAAMRIVEEHAFFDRPPVTLLTGRTKGIGIAALS